MRSFLFVPADSERKLARGPESGADALILDLEDSVVPANRPTARTPGARVFSMRPARPAFAAGCGSTRWRAVSRSTISPRPCPASPTAFCCRNACPTICARSIITCRRSRPPLRCRWAASASSRSPPRRRPRCSRSAITPGCRRGSKASPGAPRIWRPVSAATTAALDGIYDDVYRLARSLCLLAAAAAGVTPIDTIYTDFKDEAGLAAECAAARRSGFTAKMAIHPAQIPVINRAFTVSDDELAWARKVVALFAENPDAGTIALDGKMIDRPHLTLARRLLGLGGGQHRAPQRAAFRAISIRMSLNMSCDKATSAIWNVT